MIKRQISFLFADPGFCIDVFCTIAEPVRYYNRDTESGAWYISTPDWNEKGSLIREDLIFEVIADGAVSYTHLSDGRLTICNHHSF